MYNIVVFLEVTTSIYRYIGGHVIIAVAIGVLILYNCYVCMTLCVCCMGARAHVQESFK